MNSNQHSQEARAASPMVAGLDRRRFLRGVGLALALPGFESLRARGLAAEAAARGAAATGALPATTAGGAPVRMAFVYVPNGVNLSCWWPKKEGKEFELNRAMSSLGPVKDQIQVIAGLDQLNAYSGKDGAGDHARASAAFLTGVRPKKTSGADIHAGVSIDQVAARRIGRLTRFPSLELGCDAVRKSGNCDSGYSCAYQFNLAWSSPTMPLAPEVNPRLVFERLFGAGPRDERARNARLRLERDRSILDFVLEDARSLEGELGRKDRRKLDEYLVSVREIERRIQAAERFHEVPDPEMDAPRGVPKSFTEHIDLMYDLMFLAFQTDSTRIATFLVANEGSNRHFADINVNDGHHNLSHHRGNKDMLEKIARIDEWYVGRFARFLRRLDEAHDVDGHSILHNSMIVYGSGNGDGNRHTHSNLPFILAGRGGGALSTGRYRKLSSRPMSNLFLGMLDHLGIHDVPRHGDSTGRVESI